MDNDGYCLGCGADFMHGEPHYGDCAPGSTDPSAEHPDGGQR